MPEYMTKEQVVQFLQISPSTLSRYRKQGLIPCYRLGPKLTRFRRQDVMTLLQPAPEAELMSTAPVSG